MLETIYAEGKEWVPLEAFRDLQQKLMQKQRSQASHNHQFARINDLFENLTLEHAAAPYAKSADHFRKHGLIVTGHCDTDTIVCESMEAAKASAPMVARLARSAHGYAIVTVRGPVITCSVPHSQSMKAMGKERFEKSKADVIRWAEDLLGVDA